MGTHWEQGEKKKILLPFFNPPRYALEPALLDPCPYHGMPQGKEIVFRFIIEYCNLMDFGP